VTGSARAGRRQEVVGRMAGNAKLATAALAGGAPPARKSGKKKLILLVGLLLLLGGLGGGLWVTGILPPLLGTAPPPEAARGAAAEPVAPAPRPPVYLDLPEITANLNAPGRRAPFLRIRSRLELARPEDVAILQAAMPRLLDLYSTYLREMRPEELRGSAGTYRLREELMARANLVAAPARVVDVLFMEMLVQ